MSTANGSQSPPRACIIGAGSSGIAAARRCTSAGSRSTASRSPTGSAATGCSTTATACPPPTATCSSTPRARGWSTRTSRCPTSYPDFPHHTQIARVLRRLRRPLRPARADHVRDRRRARRARARTAPGRSSSTPARRRRYDALLVANGHHWDPRWPEPAFPGADTFAGEQLHAHSYVDNSIFAGKRVVVLGMGNSAMDIAVESSYVAEHTYLAARQGVWIIPKYVFGKPVDQLRNDPRIPFKIRQRMIQQLIKQLHRRPPERYGLPKPDHRFGEAHPTVSGRILDRIQHGTITPKPNIASLEGSQVRFADGSAVEADVVVYCTGYKITFPFFDEDLISAPGQPHRAVPARLSPRHPEPLLHRPAAAARRDHAAGRGPGRVGRRLPARRLRRCRRRASCAPTSPPTRPRCASATSPPSATRSRSTSTTTCTTLAAERRGAARPRSGYAPGMPTFCRHNRFIERCPICSRTLPGAAPATGAGRQAVIARSRSRRGRRLRCSGRPRRRAGVGACGPVAARFAFTARSAPQDDGYRSRARARPALLRGRRPPRR